MIPSNDSLLWMPVLQDGRKSIPRVATANRENLHVPTSTGERSIEELLNRGHSFRGAAKSGCSDLIHLWRIIGFYLGL